MNSMTVFIRQKQGKNGPFMSISMKGKYLKLATLRHSSPIKQDEWYDIVCYGATLPTDEGKYKVFYDFSWVDERKETLDAKKLRVGLKGSIAFELLERREANTGNATAFDEKPMELGTEPAPIPQPKQPAPQVDIKDEDLPF